MRKKEMVQTTGRMGERNSGSGRAAAGSAKATVSSSFAPAALKMEAGPSTASRAASRAAQLTPAANPSHPSANLNL